MARLAPSVKAKAGRRLGPDEQLSVAESRGSGPMAASGTGLGARDRRAPYH